MTIDDPNRHEGAPQRRCRRQSRVRFADGWKVVAAHVPVAGVPS